MAVPEPQPGPPRPPRPAGPPEVGPSPLTAALEAAGPRPRRPGGTALCVSPYRPWRAQRLLHRSSARFRVLVAGRGVGKTHGAAFELLQLVLGAPPRAEGAVLAPTLTHAEASVAKLRELATVVPGASWRAQARRLLLPGGRSIKVYSADRKETVRGPSLVAMLLDEGAYVALAAVEASLPALRSVGTTTRLIVATTPAGSNWVRQWWDEAPHEPGMERFRFRSTESPFMDPYVIERSRRLMSPEKFRQEYEAEFVDNLLLVFPDRGELFTDEHPQRPAPGSCWVGVDLGRKDYTTAVLMNEWGEGRVLARWNEDTPGFPAATYWAATYARVAELCREHRAVAVVDTGGPGGAPGSVLVEHLRGLGVEALEVRTNQPGTKARIVEQAKADVEWRKVKMLRNEHAETLDYEMSQFQGLKRVLHGQEVNVYEGPQVPGEHDDLVIGFCLANWGRVHGDPEPPPDDLGDFARQPAPGSPVPSSDPRRGVHRPRQTGPGSFAPAPVPMGDWGQAINLGRRF